MLKVANLVVRYGNATAVDHVSFTVAPGEIVAILGSNGAGKSSILAALSGTTANSADVMEVNGIDMRSLSIEQRAAFIAHVPEGRQLFSELTVRENLDLGAVAVDGPERARRRTRVLEALPALGDLLDRRCGQLSGGQQQMVALGRGVMSGAPVLVIDELSLGLAPLVSESFVASLDVLRGSGTAIVLVEQYVALALKVATRVAILDRGAIRALGTAAAIADDIDRLNDAYLGHGASDVGHGDSETTLTTALNHTVDNSTVDNNTVDISTVDNHTVDNNTVGVGTRSGTAAVGVVTDDTRRVQMWQTVGLGVALIGTLALGWFERADTNGVTTVMRGVDIPIGQVIAVIVGAGLFMVGGVSASRRTSGESMTNRRGALWLTVFGAAVAAVTIGARCWMLNSGLFGYAGSRFTRHWGLLIALHVAAAAVVFAWQQRKRCA
jgi:branched-chain amino acid transport system ATP-binding protein